MALMAVAPSIFSGQQMAVTFQGANLKANTMPSSKLQTRFDLVKIIAVLNLGFRPSNQTTCGQKSWPSPSVSEPTHSSDGEGEACSCLALTSMLLGTSHHNQPPVVASSMPIGPKWIWPPQAQIGRSEHLDPSQGKSHSESP